jgi:twitching motility protein PilT
MDRDALFGKIALKNRLISEKELEGYLAECRKGAGRSLGELLRERNVLSEKQFRMIELWIEQKAREKEAAAALEKVTAVAEDEEAPASPPARAEARLAPEEHHAGTRPGGAPLPPIPDLLARAKEMGASDLHISIGVRPFVRLHGELRFLEEFAPTDPETTERRIFEILSPEQRERFEARLDLDTCLEISGLGRFRTSVLRQRKGIAGVFRVIRDKVPTLEELGLPEVLRKLTTYHQGIVLITGAAGSGKSSTLAALIEIINQTRKDHVITLEDPIEYVFECKKANITQRQIEQHTQSWANALRAALREDPDVIMVGEMRDLDTMRLAITAAETGHLVLATLHTTNATRTIDRLLDVFPPKEQAQIRAMVSESLRGIVCQQLVPRAERGASARRRSSLRRPPSRTSSARSRRSSFSRSFRPERSSA